MKGGRRADHLPARPTPTWASSASRPRTCSAPSAAGDRDAPRAWSPSTIPTAGPSPPRWPQFPLSAAQLVMARRYGFASWARLVHHVERVRGLTAIPEPEPSGDPADDFLRLACLTYDDRRTRPLGRGPGLLDAHPDLPAASIHAAAAAADAGGRRAPRARPARRPARGRAVRLAAAAVPHLLPTRPATTRPTVLDDRPAAARRRRRSRTPATSGTGSPRRSPRSPARSAAARADRTRQPHHPHAHAARPPAARGRRRRQRRPGALQPHVRARRLAPRAAVRVRARTRRRRPVAGSPRRRASSRRPSCCAVQLSWAVTHDMADRVRLLIDHGVDVRSPFTTRSFGIPPAHVGRTPLDLARLTGGTGGRRRARRGRCRGPDARPGRRRWWPPCWPATPRPRRASGATDVGLLGRVAEARPVLVLDAVTTGRRSAVEVALALGFDVNATAGPGHGRAMGETALHEAAMNGEREIVEVLLAAGADPNRPRRHPSTAPRLAWAWHGDQPATSSPSSSRSPRPTRAVRHLTGAGVQQRLTIVLEVVLHADVQQDLRFDAEAPLHACSHASPSFSRSSCTQTSSRTSSSTRRRHCTRARRPGQATKPSQDQCGRARPAGTSAAESW